MFRNWCRPKLQGFSWFSPKEIRAPRDLYQATAIAKLP
jgi:hypothetical protein